MVILNTEKLWRRDCKNCNHAYYLSYKEQGFFAKLLKVKKKFKDVCPMCGSSKVRTTKLVTRTKKPTEPTQ